MNRHACIADAKVTPYDSFEPELAGGDAEIIFDTTCVVVVDFVAVLEMILAVGVTAADVMGVVVNAMLGVVLLFVVAVVVVVVAIWRLCHKWA